MAVTSIKVEALSKLYKLGEINTGTLSHDLNRFFNKALGREDSYAKIGQLNDRTSKQQSDYVWALRNIDFSINKGDVVGIIGNNGAGKSTLLKVLSKITKPTEGKIYLNGKVSSLLEVGTGFHPEMTGKENVFMNGSILGMQKKEIAQALDSIVAFAGVEKYMNTPIKRYSTGMKVRLGFAVAAHLRQDILIVDEVLAVGDAEFQKKCLGSMQQVSRDEGRTILFVSHNMAAIKSLCSKAIVLDKGSVLTQSTAEDGIRQYMASLKTTESDFATQLANTEKDTLITYNSIAVQQNGYSVSELSNDEPIHILVNYSISEKTFGFRLIILLYDAFDNLISKTFFDEANDLGSIIQPGTYLTQFTIPPNLLIDGMYKITITACVHNVRMCKPTNGISLNLMVIETGSIKRKRFAATYKGLVTLPLLVTTNTLNN